MSFKKNLRGAATFAMPANEKYRDNYDRIFGPKAVAELVPVDEAEGEGEDEFDALNDLQEKIDVKANAGRIVVAITQDRYNYLRRVETAAQAVRSKVANAMVLDNVLEDGPSEPILHYLQDPEGYVLEDIVRFVREVAALSPVGGPARARAQNLIARLAAALGEKS